MTNELFPIQLIGLGPGAPDLMSVRAHNLLSQLDTIFVPEKPGNPSLAREIMAPALLKSLDKSPRLCAVELDMRSDRTKINEAYDEAALQMIEAQQQGLNVGYVCEGDPMLYGSAIYLLDRLKGRATFEIVPAISSITACASVAQLPIVRGDQIISILPATLSDEKLSGALENCDVAVFLKAGRHMKRLKALLETMNLVENAYLVTRATQQTETITSLKELDSSHLNYFTTLLCLRSEYTWTYQQ